MIRGAERSFRLRIGKFGGEIMAKRKKSNVGPIDLVFILLAAAGLVFAVVGLFIPWMGSSAAEGNFEGGSMGLFSEELSKRADARELLDQSVLPVGLVQAFAIIGAVLALVCVAGVVIKAAKAAKINGLVSLLISIATIAVGVLVAVFSYVLGGDLSTEVGDVSVTSVFPIVGMYFCAIGTVVSGVMMLLKRN